MTSLRILVLVTVIVCAAAPATAAPAASEAIKRTFGNTIVSTYPDGRKSYLWLEADGTFKMVSRSRAASSGEWSMKGDQICLKRVHPPAPFQYCTPAPLAETWVARSVFGEKLHVTVAKGVVDH